MSSKKQSNTKNVDSINNRIAKEICENTINQLTDESLIDLYTKKESVKKTLLII